MTKPNCEVVYKNEAGEERLCQTGTPAVAVTRLDGLWWCRDCLEFLKAKAAKRTGAGRVRVGAAMMRIKMGGLLR